MIVSGVGSTTSAAPSNIQTTNKRVSDGDYKAANANTSSVKDSDGDYKPKTTSSTSTAGVQAALTGLKLGG